MTRRIMFNGVYRKPGDSPTSLKRNQEAFWTDRSGSLEALALGDQQAPGLGPGVVFGEVDFAAIGGAFRSWGTNDALKLAFNGNLKGPGIDALNDEGIWIEQDGALTLLVRDGDPSPAVGPGVNFGINSGIDTFGEVVPVMMNGPGAILFGARHRGGSIPFTRAIWTTRSGALELVAYGTIPVTGSAPGSVAPGMGPGATFSAMPSPSSTTRTRSRSRGSPPSTWTSTTSPRACGGTGPERSRWSRAMTIPCPGFRASSSRASTARSASAEAPISPSSPTCGMV